MLGAASLSALWHGNTRSVIGRSEQFWLERNGSMLPSLYLGHRVENTTKTSLEEDTRCCVLAPWDALDRRRSWTPRAWRSSGPGPPSAEIPQQEPRSRAPGRRSARRPG